MLGVIGENMSNCQHPQHCSYNFSARYYYKMCYQLLFHPPEVGDTHCIVYQTYSFSTLFLISGVYFFIIAENWGGGSKVLSSSSKIYTSVPGILLISNQDLGAAVVIYSTILDL